jgi:preprotein translocase subunit Sss1
LSDTAAVVLRVKRRAFAITAVVVLAAFLVSPRAGASLTICASVVLSSFLVLEKATHRIASTAAKPRWKTLVPLLLVTAVSFALLGLVLWRWKGFEPIAGAIGLSVVVIAIIPELWMGG